jgi:hypothetical protein
MQGSWTQLENSVAVAFSCNTCLLAVRTVISKGQGRSPNAGGLPAVTAAASLQQGRLSVCRVQIIECTICINSISPVAAKARAAAAAQAFFVAAMAGRSLCDNTAVLYYNNLKFYDEIR